MRATTLQQTFHIIPMCKRLGKASVNCNVTYITSTLRGLFLTSLVLNPILFLPFFFTETKPFFYNREPSLC
jgi:cellobiose-specific phosphotransferase system component IIC